MKSLKKLIENHMGIDVYNHSALKRKGKHCPYCSERDKLIVNIQAWKKENK